MVRCKRCTLPEAFPGVFFNELGICNFCVEAPGSLDLTALRERGKSEMTTLFNEKRGMREYDCVFALSGGKDSSYALWILTKLYNASVLAITIDNGFLSDQAVKNCKTVVDALGVDHIIFKPASDEMRRIYVGSVQSEVHGKAAVKRASSVCISCITLINNIVMKTALRHGVPIVAGGYLGGQLPSAAAVLKVDLRGLRSMRNRTANDLGARLGHDLTHRFSLPDSIQSIHADSEIYIVNPLAAEEYSEELAIATIREIGWLPPNDTGKTSSNCKLNDLGVYIHVKRNGFHPYDFEIAELVRNGQMSRDDALRKLSGVPGLEQVRDQMTMLGLDARTV